MKTTTLAFFILISTTLFSQSKIDSAVQNESLTLNLKNIRLPKKTDKNIEIYKLPEFKSQLNDSLLLRIPKNPEPNMLSFKKQEDIYNMPILVPDIQLNMPIMIPDTTIDYKLKIHTGG